MIKSQNDAVRTAEFLYDESIKLAQIGKSLGDQRARQEVYAQAKRLKDEADRLVGQIQSAV